MSNDTRVICEQCLICDIMGISSEEAGFTHHREGKIWHRKKEAAGQGFLARSIITMSMEIKSVKAGEASGEDLMNTTRPETKSAGAARGSLAR